MSSTAETIIPTQSSPLHPIQNCLDEILCEIFLSIIIDKYGRLTYSDSGKHGCPSPIFTLSAVCSKWRLVCLENAKLWTYVSIGWHSCGEEDDGISFQRMHLQMGRSKDAPLHIKAEFRWDCGRACRVAKSIFQLVANECHRWKSFTSDHDLHHDELVALFPSPPNASLLHAIEFGRSHEQYHPQSRPEGEGRTLFPVTGLTRLHSITIETLSTMSSMDPTIPWTQLTHLHIAQFDGNLGELLRYLSMCMNLEDFYLGPNVDGVEDPPTIRGHAPDSIILHNLMELAFSPTSAERGNLILPYIRTPNLCNLSYDKLDASSIKVIVDLIERSSCRITSLLGTLTKEQDPETLKSLLQALPGLTSFRIDNMGDAHWTEQDIVSCDSVLRLLCGDAESEVLCPRLECLKLQSVGFEPDLLVRFVESREGEGTAVALRDLSLLLSGKQQPLYEWCSSVLKERLEKQKARGLHLCVW